MAPLDTRHIKAQRQGSTTWTILAALLGIVLVVSCACRIVPETAPNIKVVKIDLKDGVTIKPALVSGKHQLFESAIDDLKPYAAINGTYYDEAMDPLGDIVIDGKLVNRGGQRHAIAITKNGDVEFIHRGQSRFKWSGYQAGLAAGPRLIHKGKISLDPVADGFKPSSLTVRAWRSGVGKTVDGKLLLVTAKEPLTLEEFAKVMLETGAVEAMNLDGGGACALYHDGKYLATPTLPMTNLLVVYKQPDK
ncbi:MAG TPA: phosphodiester glycosidase family protein [Armatimonadota bacterium]|nr:phosphodiester glycosidase family protein [Armatimonadota bacterium]HPP74290.1 phosphodiester glycosidase family protein [Armatimonadota bacterium]